MISFDLIGERIKEQRKNMDISQSELSKLLNGENINMSRETISKIENGTRAINAVEIKSISNILNISLEELFEENESDLVGLFRSNRNDVSDEMIKEIEDVQNFIEAIIMQKKISTGELKLKKYNNRR